MNTIPKRRNAETPKRRNAETPKRRKLRFCSEMVIAVSLVTGLTPNLGMAQAPTPKFRAFDLGRITAPPGSIDFGTDFPVHPLAMNNNHEVTGQMIGGRIFLWLPATNYGQLAETMIDLGALHQSLNIESAGMDINDHGDIVARVGAGLSLPGCDAWHIKLNNDGTVTPNDLSTLFPGSIIATEVPTAINNLMTDPIMVGRHVDSNDGTVKGWRIVLDGSPSVEFLTTTNLDLSRANDVNDVGLIPAVAGSATDDIQFDLCTNPADGFKWKTNPIAIEGLATTFATNLLAEAYGINNSEDIVGFGANSPYPCERDALVFQSGSHLQPFNLGAVLPLSTQDDTYAIKITNSTPLQVVGHNSDMNEGLLWIKQGIDWFAFVLNDHLVSCQSTGPGSWGIRQAMDISDDGWIIAYGFVPSDTEVRALLLVPESEVPLDPTCPADVNNDGVVAVADLLQLLAAWGSCSGTFCYSDINCDNDVGTPDLLALFAAWGGCPNSGNTASSQFPQSLTDCSNWYPNDCYMYCQCVKKLCAIGAISAEQCAGVEDVICDPNCNNN